MTDEPPTDDVPWQWTGQEWVVLDSPEHRRMQELHDFLWDHASLLLGEPETFTRTTYDRTEADCRFCGARKHFARRDAAIVKEIHKMGNFNDMRKQHPELTLDFLDQHLAQLRAAKLEEQ